ncbi:copper resistance protein B [Enterovibrio paralichthyis]|uniref:copper resistance protein B n=1 Tax=Enterovibrio paralichthyis TaxID=2853805 RepID=UPI001C472E2C|nr:copper resistance protein B [Enterovibrio paralichthyis]MBV7299766.1 copper resistance protein B [Enterovibrio paralichthyis]
MKIQTQKTHSLLMRQSMMTLALVAALSATANAGAEPAGHDGMALTEPSQEMTAGRDPNEYSGGLTLNSGPYLLDGVASPELADQKHFWGLRLDRLEYQDFRHGDDPINYEGEVFYGGDYNKVVLQSEGDIVDGELDESSSNLLWRHAISSFWDVQGGVRYDTLDSNDRFWVTAGFKGLAPYWFEVDAMLAVGENGQVAVDVEAEYEVLLTQRLIAQPSIALRTYGKDDTEWDISRLTPEMATGLRVRYEFSRKFAPYLGVEWQTDFGKDSSKTPDETLWVAGVRIWF